MANLTDLITGIFESRSARGSLVINGVDILAGLAQQNIVGFTYTDSTSDKADDLKIEVADPLRIWMQQYLPKKGIECDAYIIVHNWAFPGDNRPFHCGHFWIDKLALKGPPNKVSITASSIPVTAGIKNQKKHKSWESSDLKGIAGEIAAKNQLTLAYDTKTNPKVKRTDQVDKSDLEYLRDRVKEASLSLKIHNKQLVIYSEEEYEAREAVFTIVYGQSHIVEYDFESKADDTYAKAKNSYLNPETGKLNETEFAASSKPDGSEEYLLLNEKPEYDPDSESDTGAEVSGRSVPTPEVGSSDFVDYQPDLQKDAGKGAGGKSSRKVKAKLREKNKKEKTSNMTVFGNPLYLSGLNVQLQGFGIFDAKWFIETSTHEIAGSGYTTKLKYRQTLKGY